MRASLLAAGCGVLLLLSTLGATQLVPAYAAVAALPLASRSIPAAVAVAATVAVTWHPFDLVAALVAAIVSGACFTVPQTA
jgi:riboflavin transporter FmnP